MSKKEERRAQVLNKVLAKEWRVGEAAALLGISKRQGWRQLAAYRVEGIAGLVHGNRGRRPAHATPEKTKAQVQAAAKGPYDGANFSHITDLLREREGITLSRSTVSRMLHKAGVQSPKYRRQPKHRSRRPRYPQEGMLLQVDGSRHRWLGPEGPFFTLVGAIDDATGAVPYALFREQEDAQGYFLLVREIVGSKGVPLAFYSDRHTIFAVPEREPETPEEQLAGKRRPTQLGRALEALGIELILAHSPQAKGRIERLWQAFQDRLVIELRLAKVQTLEQANQFLWTFLPKYSAQFAVPAAQPETAYRPKPEGLDPDGILCFRYDRIVAADNTVSFAGRSLQIQPDGQRGSYARTRVEVQERLNGQVVVVYQGRILVSTQAPPLPVVLRARKRQGQSSSRPESRLVGERGTPVITERAAEPGRPALSHEDTRVPARKPPVPASNHPWRHQPLSRT